MLAATTEKAVSPHLMYLLCRLIFILSPILPQMRHPSSGNTFVYSITRLKKEKQIKFMKTDEI